MELLVSETAAQTAADVIVRKLTGALRSRGQASIAFSGGATPGPMFDALAASPIPWSEVDIFQVDERVVAVDDPARNWHSLSKRLVERTGTPASRRHPMPVESSDLPSAAREYGDDIAKNAPLGLDVVHLGLGSDGHTASWPPADPVVTAVDPVAVVGPFQDHLRMTLTPVTVNHAKARVWLVSGHAKARALELLRSSDPAIPASSAVQASGDVLVCDPPAVT